MIVKPLKYGFIILFLKMVKNGLLFFMAIGVFFLLVAFVTKNGQKDNFENAKEMIVMRNIAHQILRYAGDSTSRIMPVHQIAENEFQIPFESSFSFKPDSLVRIIHRIIANNQLPEKYIVNVLDCNSKNIVFGYAILGNETSNIIPCSGRDQPNMKYCIQIQFQESKLYNTKNLYLAGAGLLSFSLLMMGMWRFKKRGNSLGAVEEEKEEVQVDKTFIPIGNYQFYPAEYFLLCKDEKIMLTTKESKILHILALQQNQIIDRDRLQKEVWENEGVIVGRSLDMFISKLRKKLEQDEQVKITNVHSRGYKLEVSS